MKCPNCKSENIKTQIAGPISAGPSEISETGKYDMPSTELVRECLDCGSEF